MANLNKTRASLFLSHPAVNTFLFTSDDQGFFEKDAAMANTHADELKRKYSLSAVVDTITRSDYNAWWAEYAPQYAADRLSEVGMLEKALKLAEANLAKLPANTGAAKKAPYIAAVNDAKKNLEAIIAESDKANADAAPFINDAELKAAEQQLAADAAANADATTINADTVAVDTAKKKAGKK